MTPDEVAGYLRVLADSRDVDQRDQLILKAAAFIVMSNEMPALEIPRD